MGILSDLLKEIPLSTVLKEKITTFEQEIAALKQENATLKDDNRKFQAENKRLKDEIQSLTHTDDLAEEEIKILTYLADSNTPNYRDSIAINLNLNETHLDYFLTILRERDYITWTGSPEIEGVSIKYHLTQKGRVFLIQNNLI
ncbi:MAG TPA: cell division protein ZapB [Pyrinomonadaceae bacterium]